MANGFDESTVQDVLHWVQRAEFKRKQSAPGIKVTDRAFGTGWRMPIVRKEAQRERAQLYETPEEVL